MVVRWQNKLVHPSLDGTARRHYRVPGSCHTFDKQPQSYSRWGETHNTWPRSHSNRPHRWPLHSLHHVDHTHIDSVTEVRPIIICSSNISLDRFLLRFKFQILKLALSYTFDSLFRSCCFHINPKPKKVIFQPKRNSNIFAAVSKKKILTAVFTTCFIISRIENHFCFVMSVFKELLPQ